MIKIHSFRPRRDFDISIRKEQYLFKECGTQKRSNSGEKESTTEGSARGKVTQYEVESVTVTNLVTDTGSEEGGREAALELPSDWGVEAKAGRMYLLKM